MPAKTTPPLDDLSNPYGYSEMDWAAQLDPAYAAARAEVRRLSVGEDGTLSVKVKELIVLGVLASRGLQYGVEAHMRRAITYGATRKNCSRPSKPPPSLVVVWLTVWVSGRSRHSTRMGPSRLLPRPQPRVGSGGKPPHTAPAGRSRPAVKAPDTRHLEGGRLARHVSVVV